MEHSSPGKTAVLLFTIDKDVEVFHLLTVEEAKQEPQPEPYEVYWQSKSQRIVYGPFTSVNSALHHNSLRKSQRPETPATSTIPFPGKVIDVDFRAKKRL